MKMDLAWSMSWMRTKADWALADYAGSGAAEGREEGNQADQGYQD